MNSTTSFDFTSFSMNCSMLIFDSFWTQPLVPWFYGLASARKTNCYMRAGISPFNPTLSIYLPPNPCASKVKWRGAGMQGKTPEAAPKLDR
jgi:hypothetical protein